METEWIHKFYNAFRIYIHKNNIKYKKNFFLWMANEIQIICKINCCD